MKTKSLVAFLSLAICCATPVRAQTRIDWTGQLGTSEYDSSTDVSADGLGNVYIARRTDGDLGGPNAGGSDAFISKYDVSGSLLWTQQLGTSEYDQAHGVSADGLGNVYIAGRTDGDLGGPNAGNYDAFISKYDSSGSIVWTQQLGSSERDYSNGVSADGLGNVYIAGSTWGDLGGPNAGDSDAFISKYDSSGSLLWTQQFGTEVSDEGRGVSADGLGNVYIAGYANEFLGTTATDTFISKYDSSGSLLWTQQFGSSWPDYDSAHGVSADGLGNVYIAGYIWGSHADSDDAYVNKYDASGSLLWTQQLGTRHEETAYGVSADGLGNVYIAGSTSGNLGGPNAAYDDAFISKYDASGSLLWTQQLGTREYDRTHGVSTDRMGNVYIAGSTGGDLGGPNAGSRDAFLAKLSEIEPGACDFNGDMLCDVTDIDMLSTEIRTGTHEVRFDVTRNGFVDNDDRQVWVEELKGTFFGDGNLDGKVDASDLNNLALNWRVSDATSWAQGDFNGDGNVNANDLNDIGLNWRSGVTSSSVTLRPGDIIISDADERRIVRLDPGTGDQTIISSGGYIQHPWGIEIDAAGEIIVSDSLGGLFRINPQKGEQTRIPNSIIEDSPNDVTFTKGFAIADNGDLLVSGFALAFGQVSGQISRVDPLTGATTLIANGGLLSDPPGLAIDDRGDLIVGNQFGGREDPHSDPIIVRVDPSTGEQSTVSRADVELQYVNGLILDVDGTIVVTGAGRNTSGVYTIDPVTGDQALFSSGELLRFGCAGGITLDHDGDYLVANPCNRSVVRVDSTTGDQTVIATPGLQPVHIAVVPFPPGDFNRAGIVNVNDADVLVAGNVPEPSALLLTFVGLALICRRFRGG